MIIGGERTPGGLMRRSRGGSEASFAGVQSPPLRGDAFQYRRFHGGKSGDRAKGGFLGGARSPRPRWKAARKPGYGMTAGR